jgi:1,4-alpha-glucan branching enzyme
VQAFIRDVCRYWLDTYELDGIRFDYTMGFYRQGHNDVGISKLLGDLRAHLDEAGRENVVLIVEHLTDNRYEAINDTNQMGATGCWFDPFMYECQHNGREGRAGGKTMRILNSKMDFEADKWPVTYIENHDHSRLANKVGGRLRWFKTQPAAIALFSAPGMTMIYNGQEIGEDYYLPDEGAGRVVPRPLRWQAFEDDPAGQRLHFLYSKLAGIRRDHPALRGPNVFPQVEAQEGYGIVNESLIIFHRYGETEEGLARYIIVVNFGDDDQWVRVPFSSNGQWKDLLNGETVEITDFWLPNCQVTSNWGRIFYQLAA